MPATDVFSITKEELKTLYFKDRLSMFQIAKKYGCSHSAIVYKFKKFKLKSRGNLGLTKPIKITKSGFQYLYYKRGLSLRKIAKIVHCSEGGLERRFRTYDIISRGNKNRACKYKREDFSNNLIEKAYLIGFRLGDLNIIKRIGVIQARCSTSVPAQARLIKNLFKQYTTPNITIAKRGTYEIVCLVNKSFDFLLTKKDEIPKWIETNKECFFSFLAGYSDAEGCFYLKKPGKLGKTRTSGFEIQTQQKQIIHQIWKGLQRFGIYCTKPKISVLSGRIDKRGVINNKDMWRITVCKKIYLWEFIQQIQPFIKHRNKIKKIKEVKNNLILRNSIPYGHPINLTESYIS